MDADYERYLYLRRLRFTTVVYVTTVALILLSIFQWMPIRYFEKLANLFIYKSEISAGLFAAGLFVLFFYVFFEDLRLYRPANMIFGFIIFECFVIGIGPFIMRQYKLHLYFSFFFWFAVLFLLILIGQLIPWDLTMYLPMIVLSSFICLLVGFYFLMLHVTINIPYTFFIYRLLICVCLFMFIMYHAQLIRGGRHAEFRPFDYGLGAFTLYLDFLLLFLFSFEVSPKWSDPCNHNATFVFILDHYVPKFKTSY